MYVVAGVSGNTGKVVAETLLAQKQPVRVIVRDAEKGAAWKARGADVAVAGLDDVGALTKALAGAKGAYLLLPPQMASSDSLADNTKRMSGYIKAIASNSVPHVAFLSSIGAQHANGTGPIVSLHHAEVALRTLPSTTAVTAVRAAYFLENWGGSLYALGNGELPTFLTKDRAIAMVAAHDIGTTAAHALLEGGKGFGVVELSGARDYSPTDIAAALSRITRKPVKAVQGPIEAMVPALLGAGLNAHWAGLYEEMTRGINAGHVAFEGGSTRSRRGTSDVDAALKALVGGASASH